MLSERELRWGQVRVERIHSRRARERGYEHRVRAAVHKLLRADVLANGPYGRCWTLIAVHELRGDIMQVVKAGIRILDTLRYVPGAIIADIEDAIRAWQELLDALESTDEDREGYYRPMGE